MDWLIAVKTCSALNASWALRGRQIQARRRAGPIIANAKQLSRRVEGSGAPTAFVVAPAVLMFAKTAAEPALANEDLNLVEGNSREAQIGRIGIVERRCQRKGFRWNATEERSQRGRLRVGGERHHRGRLRGCEKDREGIRGAQIPRITRAVGPTKSLEAHTRLGIIKGAGKGYAQGGIFICK